MDNQRRLSQETVTARAAANRRRDLVRGLATKSNPLGGLRGAARQLCSAGAADPALTEYAIYQSHREQARQATQPVGVCWGGAARECTLPSIHKVAERVVTLVSMELPDMSETSAI